MNDDHEWKGGCCAKCGLRRSLLVETPVLVLTPPSTCEDLCKRSNSHDWEFRESHRGPCYVMSSEGNFSSTTVYHDCWVCRRCNVMSRYSDGPPFSEIMCTGRP